MPGISFSIEVRYCAFVRPHLRLLLDPGHLRQQQRRLELRHAQVGAGRGVSEVRSPVRQPRAVVVEGMAAFPQFFVVADHRAALAGVEVLGCLEAEAAGLSVRAHLAAAPFRQVRLAGVLEHRDLVLRGDREDRVEIADAAPEVHRDDRLGRRRDRRFELARVHLHRLAVGIDEDRQRVLPQHHVHRRDERVRRHDHFVARLHAQRIQAGVQRGGAVRRGQAVFVPVSFAYASSNRFTVWPVPRFHLPLRRVSSIARSSVWSKTGQDGQLSLVSAARASGVASRLLRVTCRRISV